MIALAALICLPFILGWYLLVGLFRVTVMLIAGLVVLARWAREQDDRRCLRRAERILRARHQVAPGTETELAMRAQA